MVSKFISIIGWQNSGKTTLITKLVKEFRLRGLKVGTIKHVHDDFEIDHKGKDSYRHFHAGADSTCVVSKSKFALIRREAIGQKDLLKYFKGFDLVLVEGFKSGSLPKIEIAAPGRSFIHDNEKIQVKAIICDDRNSLYVPVFKRSQIKQIADFILNV